MREANKKAATAPDPVTPALVGGHPALDLVNTVSWRLDEHRLRDNLTSPAALIAWCHRAGLVDEQIASTLITAASIDEQDGQIALRNVLALREQLGTVLESVRDYNGLEDARKRHAKIVISHDLRSVLVDTLAHSELAGPPMLWRLSVQQLNDLPRILTLSTLDLLQSPHLYQLRRCAGPGCGWMFLDRTRSHTRRWCSTSDCGNRDRARRHYARQRSEASRDATTPSQ